MAESDEQKVLKMSLMCSICLQKLNKPRSLPCFHTFCESCLNNHFINAPGKDNATREGIPCPVCKANTFSPKPLLPVKDWAESFPLNHLVGTLIDIVPVSARLEFCDPCKDNKESKVANSWCQQCSEALCDDCTKCHKSMKATKKHEISALEGVRSNPKQTITEEVTCPQHGKKNVDMYCQDHETPCCAMCIAIEHRKCDKICQLAEVVKQNNPNDAKSVLKDTEKVVAEADKVKKERQEVMRSTQAQKMKMLKEIAEAKEKLLKHIEKLESQITAKFNAVSTTDFAILQEQIDYCNSVQSAMHHSKTAILAAKDQKLPKKEFIVVQQGKNKIKDCSDGLKKIHENSAKIQYLFEEDKQVAETIGALSVLGKLDVKHSYPNMKPVTPPPPPTPIPVDDDNEQKAIKKSKAFTVKVKGDRRECNITSIKVMNNKNMLIADHSNLKLKLFEEFGELLCTLTCQHPPWDFTFMEKNKFATTFPNERKIRLFTLKEASITEVGYIQSTRGARGVCYADGDLVVTYTAGCIRLIALDGSVKMMVDTDYIGKRVFSNPEFIAYNPFSSRVYVSDYNNHTVTALRIDKGKVDKTPLFIYPVSGPRGVSVDKQGNLYVCGFWSNDIHKVKDTGQNQQVFGDSLARPQCLAFFENCQKFAVSEQGNPNQVKFFKIVAEKEDDD